VAREDLLELFLQAGARQHAVDEVRPVEGPDELERRAQLQLGGDVAADARGGSGGEGMQADAGKPVAHRPELPVLRPEIVAPLADAVRLVDRDVRHPAEPLDERLAALTGQPLRRHVEQGVTPLTDAGRDRRLPVGAHRAVVERRLDAVFDQRVDLVLHQRDQRRHHQAQPAADQRRRLEAERLAAAGRQHDDRVAPRHDRVHRLALQRAERGVAPVGGECVFERGHGV
jgi:hypothetical protein